MRRWLAFLVGLGSASCGLPDGDYFGRVPERPEQIDPTHLRWCSQGEPDHLDPTLAFSTASWQLVFALFDGLTTYGSDALPVPGLATRWEVAADLRRFTFHLRRDAQWSSGRPVTAYDVAHSVFRVANPLTGSANADQLAPIKGATAYLERRALVLRRAVGPYAAGEVVERMGDAAPDVNARTASRPLALRDLGAAPDAAYAVVPAGQEVTLVMTTGGRATLPAPGGTGGTDGTGGAAWAYVFWPRDVEGVAGWVPAGELDGEPAAGRALQVRRAAARDIPAAARGAGGTAPGGTAPGGTAPGGPPPGDGGTAPGGPPPGDGDRPVVTVHARDVVISTDAIGVTVPDPYTIVFETADPTPYFVALTAAAGLRPTPIDAWSRWPRRWDRPEHIVTSGPFELAAWRERDRIELSRSPRYWDRDHVALARLTSLSLDDQAAATNAYFTGACDATAANTIPSSYLPAVNGELRGGRAYKDYRAAPMLGVYFLWIQTEKLPSRHLRRALALAIDRTRVPRFTHGGEIPTAQLTPGTPIAELAASERVACGVTADTPGAALVMADGQCYVPPPGLDYDPAAARRELALARAEGGVPDAPIEYRFNAGSEGHKQIAEYLQAAWAQIGVPVVLAAEDWNALLDDTGRGEFAIARFGSVGTLIDAESEFLSLLRCGAAANRGRYCSPAFERLMDQARTLAEPAARNARLRAAEAVMIEDAPVVPIYILTQKHLIKPYVRDYAINLLDQPPLGRIWIDPAWRSR